MNAFEHVSGVPDEGTKSEGPGRAPDMETAETHILPKQNGEEPEQLSGAPVVLEQLDAEDRRRREKDDEIELFRKEVVAEIKRRIERGDLEPEGWFGEQLLGEHAKTLTPQEKARIIRKGQQGLANLLEKARRAGGSVGTARGEISVEEIERAIVQSEAIVEDLLQPVEQPSVEDILGTVDTSVREKLAEAGLREGGDGRVRISIAGSGAPGQFVSAQEAPAVRGIIADAQRSEVSIEELRSRVAAAAGFSPETPEAQEVLAHRTLATDEGAPVGEETLEHPTPAEVGAIEADLRITEYSPTFILEHDFNLSPDEIEQLGFDALSEGQQHLVIHNLDQLVLGRVYAEADDERAGARTEPSAEGEDTRKNFLARVWRGLSSVGGGALTLSGIAGIVERGKQVKARSAKAKEVFAGGIGVHGQTLETLIGNMREHGPEAAVNTETGEIEIAFVSSAEGLPYEQEARNVNEAAQMLAHVSYEESLSHRGAHHRALVAYEVRKQEYVRALENTGATERSHEEARTHQRDIAQEMLAVDRQIRLQQFLNQHPNAEKTLRELADEKVWKYAAKEVLFSAGSFGLGALSRKMLYGALGALGSVAAPAVAAGTIGGVRSWRRTAESFREAEKRARRGAEKHFEEGGVRDYERGNVVDASVQVEKLNRVITAATEAEDSEQQQRAARSLKARVSYLERKLKEGRVNFGTADASLTNQINVLETVGQAQAHLEQLVGDGNRLEAKLHGMLDVRDKKINRAQLKRKAKEALKGSVLAAGFVGAGHAVAGWFGGEVGAQSDAVHSEPIERFVAEESVVESAEAVRAIPASPLESLGVIEKGGSLWEVGRSYVGAGELTDEQFTRLWENSMVEIDGKEMSLEQMGLVHVGDRLDIAWNEDGTPNSFVFQNASDIPAGDNTDLAEAFRSEGKDVPMWLQEALADDEGGVPETVVAEGVPEAETVGEPGAVGGEEVSKEVRAELEGQKHKEVEAGLRIFTKDTLAPGHDQVVFREIMTKRPAEDFLGRIPKETPPYAVKYFTALKQIVSNSGIEPYHSTLLWPAETVGEYLARVRTALGL